MNLSELQQKDIINIFDGRKLGRIVDASVNDTGLIIHFTIEPKRFFRIFSSKEEVDITFNQIKKIGEDVILVEL